MPIYEYECTKCEKSIEVIQKMSDEPIKTCEDCKTPTMKKVISPSSFRLKGSGWYETDFKSKK